MTTQHKHGASAGSERMASCAEQIKYTIVDGSGMIASCADREAYLFGELDVESSEAFERHQRGCAACQQEVSEHLALSALLAPSQGVFSILLEAEHQRILEGVFSSVSEAEHQQSLGGVSRSKSAEGIATATDGLKNSKDLNSSDLAVTSNAASTGQTKPFWFFSTLHSLFSLRSLFSLYPLFSLRSLFSFRLLAWSALVCILVGATVLLGRFETPKGRKNSETQPLSRSLSNHAARRSPDVSHRVAHRSPDVSHRTAPSPRYIAKVQRLVVARASKTPTVAREPKNTASMPDESKNMEMMPDVSDVWLHQKPLRIVARPSQSKQRGVETHSQKSGQNLRQQGIEARRQQGIYELEAVRVVVAVPEQVGQFTNANTRHHRRLQKDATVFFSDVVVRVVPLDARYGSGEDARYGSGEDARHGIAEMEVRIEDDPNTFLPIRWGGADAVEVEKDRTAERQEKARAALPWVPKVIPRDIAEETKQPVLIL